MAKKVSRSRLAGCVLVLAVLAGLFELSAHSAEREFRIRFSSKVRDEPFTGRVYVFSHPAREPRLGLNWFRPSPFVSVDVANWQPDTWLTIKSPAADSHVQHPKPHAFPQPLAEWDTAPLQLQAVARFNPWEREIGSGPGNGYSQSVAPAAPQQPANTIDFTIDQLVPQRTFVETNSRKQFVVRSQRLSDFHGRDVFLQAAVHLPFGYSQDVDRRYPVIFEIPGFGGTHHDELLNSQVPDPELGGVKFIRVLLDPACPLGHHVFADSANNGPVGAALVHEFLPEFDRKYRTRAAAHARFLTGHSSGGWSSLWLQIAYPETFGGTWSTSPDPVDFRDFQQINLYRPGENMYVDADGSPRPLARIQGRPVAWYRDFDRMEQTLGHGGQLASFEAVFSPRAENGEPAPLWDRDTGEIDPQIAKAWEAYDIRLVLERNWDELGPKLAGKLHVIMGEEDTFYLEGATRLLRQSLARRTDEPIVTMLPGYTHMNLLTPEVRTGIRQGMVDAFLEHDPPGE